MSSLGEGWFFAVVQRQAGLTHTPQQVLPNSCCPKIIGSPKKDASVFSFSPKANFYRLTALKILEGPLLGSPPPAGDSRTYRTGTKMEGQGSFLASLQKAMRPGRWRPMW